MRWACRCRSGPALHARHEWAAHGAVSGGGRWVRAAGACKGRDHCLQHHRCLPCTRAGWGASVMAGAPPVACKSLPLAALAGWLEVDLRLVGGPGPPMAARERGALAELCTKPGGRRCCSTSDDRIGQGCS